MSKTTATKSTKSNGNNGSKKAVAKVAAQPVSFDVNSLLAAAGSVEKPAPAKRGRTSVLAAADAVIVTLHGKGFNARQMTRWLNENGVSVKYGTVKHYLDVKYPGAVRHREVRTEAQTPATA